MHPTTLQMERQKKQNQKKKIMEKAMEARAHCLVLAFPGQGHINPMLEFSKRLVHKGLKVTLVTTKSISNTLQPHQSSAIDLKTISDGYDVGGIAEAETIEAYISTFRQVGSQTLAELVEELCATGSKVDCIVYDAFLPWALDVAKRFGIVGAVFFTQSCAVGNILHQVFLGKQKLPVITDGDEKILLPGMPPLEGQDMPSYLRAMGHYPAFRDMLVNQFSNLDDADWVLCNTFHALEEQVVEWMAKFWPSLRTIGPAIPSMYLDKRLKDDKAYGFNLFKPNIDACMNWLNDRAKGSVVYVSFGSTADLEAAQMEEIAWGLRRSNNYFLWVVRPSEEAKLPKDFVKETSDKGLVVSWCPQLEVLAHDSVGCFLTHCGWNSTLEALSLGVPMIAMPQWIDQGTNAKFIMDVWKMGLRVSVDENGVAMQQDVEHCIREVMEGERGREMKNNASKWKRLAKEAADEGGSSDTNIYDFVAKLLHL